MNNVTHSQVNEGMRIDGVSVKTDAVIEVRYPFNNELVGTVPAGRHEHAARAFDVASKFTPKLSRFERQRILFDAADLLLSKREQFANIITLELGISFKDAWYECGRAVDVFSLSAQMAVVDDGEIHSCDITRQGQARKIFTHRVPVGTISAITPFNHPLNMVAHKIGPSIATNNCLVCKPAEQTPLTALMLADLLYEAGLPPQMFQVVTGSPAVIGESFVVNEKIDLITFTGGVEVGKLVAAKCGTRRAALEMGGNDPFIVLNDLSDAELRNAAYLAVTGATKNSGQRCTAIKRILVQNKVADRFVPFVVEFVKAINFGDPLDRNTNLGCVVNEKSAIKIEGRVTKAVEEGAEFLYNPPRKGALLPPICLDHVDPRSKLVFEETFGPIVPIIRVSDDDEEVIKVSNSTPFGLSSGVCGNNLTRLMRYVHGLQVGTVNIWEVPGYRTELSPFGGIKDSGNGVKEGVGEAMKFFTHVKTWSMPWA